MNPERAAPAATSTANNEANTAPPIILLDEDVTTCGSPSIPPYLSPPRSVYKSTGK